MLILVICSPLLVYGGEFRLFHENSNAVDGVFSNDNSSLKLISGLSMLDSVAVRDKIGFGFGKNAELIRFLGVNLGQNMADIQRDGYTEGPNYNVNSGCGIFGVWQERIFLFVFLLMLGSWVTFIYEYNKLSFKHKYND